jgi:hypothetical protein
VPGYFTVIHTLIFTTTVVLFFLIKRNERETLAPINETCVCVHKLLKMFELDYLFVLRNSLGVTVCMHACMHVCMYVHKLLKMFELVYLLVLRSPYVY